MSAAILFVSAAIAASGSTLVQTPADVHKPGDGVTSPVLVRDVKPGYTPDAMRRGIRGTIKLECIVETDGSVSSARVTIPLDEELDAQAVAALTQWRFKPGMKDGKAVRTLIEVEMSFTLAGGPRLDSPEVFKPGSGVMAPTVLKEVKPTYPASMRGAGIQGIVTVDCVVLPDGSVGDTRVTRGLAPELDREAVRSMRLWRFNPGRKDGKPVPVQVSVEISFTLK
jgi:TonB family protein